MESPMKSSTIAMSILLIADVASVHLVRLHQADDPPQWASGNRVARAGSSLLPDHGGQDRTLYSDRWACGHWLLVPSEFSHAAGHSCRLCAGDLLFRRPMP